MLLKLKRCTGRGYKRGMVHYVVTRRVDTPIKDKWVNRLFYRDADRWSLFHRLFDNSYHTGVKEALTIPSAMTDLPRTPKSLMALLASYPGRFIVGHIGALVDRHKRQRILLEGRSAITA